jgi:DNA polymerase-3 subunit epsilon
VGAELLNHIGRHLSSSYGMDQVESALLVSVNKLSAAKVPAFLDKYVSAKKSEAVD